MDGHEDTLGGVRGARDGIDGGGLCRDDGWNHGLRPVEVGGVVARRDDLDSGDFAARNGNLHGDGTAKAGARTGVDTVFEVGGIDTVVGGVE